VGHYLLENYIHGFVHKYFIILRAVGKVNQYFDTESGEICLKNLSML